MRKLAAGAATAVLLGGSLGLTAGPAAAASPALGSTAPVAEVAPQAAACVTVVDWYSEKSGRYVKVKNSCARTACFSVTMALRKDPSFSIGANKTASFRYGGTLGVKGSGIKNKAC
ncbi:hypothetical protein QNO07_15600 [Streptomyces sp. 549]|uniref:hypothetical protein n=1 Tax=Streptomyces sp. 549 TaxID=3049076 RepID=UPI0024C443B6|nr:hypothetical protein [Streptomyces sp. 549]MDK1474827.1 hypothetical protein [Streptomyces sp. 549]